MGLCESKLEGQGRSWVVQRVAGVLEAQTGAAVKKAVWVRGAWRLKSSRLTSGSGAGGEGFCCEAQKFSV